MEIDGCSGKHDSEFKKKIKQLGHNKTIFLESNVTTFQSGLWMNKQEIYYLFWFWVQDQDVARTGLVHYLSFWHIITSHTPTHRGRGGKDWWPLKLLHFTHLSAILGWLQSFLHQKSLQLWRCGSLSLLQFTHHVWGPFSVLCSSHVAKACVHLLDFRRTIGGVRCCCKSWMLPNCKQ
jgi:hypothetical protein